MESIHKLTEGPGGLGGGAWVVAVQEQMSTTFVEEWKGKAQGTR